MGNFLTSLIKFILSLLLLPIVLACVFSFQHHLVTYPSDYQEFFLWGLTAFLIIFLFFYQFWGVYEFGQKVMGDILKFTAPLNNFVSCLIPFYLTIILIFFYLVRNFLGFHQYDPYFMFFAGFALAMHIFLTAQDLQDQEKSPLKPTYYLSICITITVNIIVMALLMDLILKKWTFPVLLHDMIVGTQNKYDYIFHQMFGRH